MSVCPRNPNCTECPICWDEEAGAKLRQTQEEVERLRVDRDEWQQQHENLLAMYQAETTKSASLRAQVERMRGALHEFKEAFTEFDPESQACRIRMRRALIQARDALSPSPALDNGEARKWLCRKCGSTTQSSSRIGDRPICGGCHKYVMGPPFPASETPEQMEARHDEDRRRLKQQRDEDDLYCSDDTAEPKEDDRQ